MDFLQPDEPDLPPDINTTPLIDVLLVLLVMLIVTIPLPPTALPVTLPRPAAAEQTPPPVIRLRLDADGATHWNDELLADVAALEAHLDALAAQPAPPGLRLAADGAVAYGRVVAVLATVNRHGLRDFALVGTRRQE